MSYFDLRSYWSHHIIRTSSRKKIEKKKEKVVFARGTYKVQIVHLSRHSTSIESHLRWFLFSWNLCIEHFASHFRSSHSFSVPFSLSLSPHAVQNISSFRWNQNRTNAYMRSVNRISLLDSRHLLLLQPYHFPHGALALMCTISFFTFHLFIRLSLFAWNSMLASGNRRNDKPPPWYMWNASRKYYNVMWSCRMCVCVRYHSRQLRGTNSPETKTMSENSMAKKKINKTFLAHTLHFPFASDQFFSSSSSNVVTPHFSLSRFCEWVMSSQCSTMRWTAIPYNNQMRTVQQTTTCRLPSTVDLSTAKCRIAFDWLACHFNISVAVNRITFVSFSSPGRKWNKFDIRKYKIIAATVIVCPNGSWPFHSNVFHIFSVASDYSSSNHRNHKKCVNVSLVTPRDSVAPA